jgi:dihydroceramidase
MIYTACILFYAIFSHGQSTRNSILLSIFLTAMALFITLYYHYLQDPLFHQNMFALLTCIGVFRSMYAMEKKLRPSRRAKVVKSGHESEQKRVDQRNRDILKTMWIMIACGVSSFACGFLIWNLDNIYCSSLRRWRREIGLPWGILLEGHGWW